MFRIAARQGVLLAAVAVVGLARLSLSIAGLPDSTVRWLSMNAVVWTATPASDSCCFAAPQPRLR